MGKYLDSNGLSILWNKIKNFVSDSIKKLNFSIVKFTERLEYSEERLDIVENGKVDKVEGKQLSTEDFTTILKTKLEGLTNYNDAELTAKIDDLKTRLDVLVGSDDATAVIDTFQEIEAFLQGVTNTETLTGLLQEMKGEIVAMFDNYLPKSSLIPTEENTIEISISQEEFNNISDGQSYEVELTNTQYNTIMNALLKGESIALKISNSDATELPTITVVLDYSDFKRISDFVLFAYVNSLESIGFPTNIVMLAIYPNQGAFFSINKDMWFPTSGGDINGNTTINAPNDRILELNNTKASHIWNLIAFDDNKAWFGYNNSKDVIFSSKEITVNNQENTVLTKDNYDTIIGDTYWKTGETITKPVKIQYDTKSYNDSTILELRSTSNADDIKFNLIKIGFADRSLTFGYDVDVNSFYCSREMYVARNGYIHRVLHEADFKATSNPTGGIIRKIDFKDANGDISASYGVHWNCDKFQFAYIGFGNNNNYEASKSLRISPTVFSYFNNKVWHEGNDGTGSGLDADLLDGFHSDKFAYRTNGVIPPNQWVSISPINGSSLISLRGSNSDRCALIWVSSYNEGAASRFTVRNIFCYGNYKVYINTTGDTATLYISNLNTSGTDSIEIFSFSTRPTITVLESSPSNVKRVDNVDSNILATLGDNVASATKATNLACRVLTTEDLNTIKIDSFASFTGNYNNTCKNKPTNCTVFSLQQWPISGLGNAYVQQLYNYTNYGVYYRLFFDNQWSDWKEVITERNIQTVIENVDLNDIKPTIPKTYKAPFTHTCANSPYTNMSFLLEVYPFGENGIKQTITSLNGIKSRVYSSSGWSNWTDIATYTFPS